MVKAAFFVACAIAVTILGIVLEKKIESKGKRALLLVVRVLITLVFLVMGFYAYLTRNVGLKIYDDIDKFNEEYHDEFYVPDGAEDVRMAINNRLLAKTFLVSYVLDDEELEALTEEVIVDKYTKTNDDGDKEIQFDEYYGIQVKDINDVNPGYTGDDFQEHLKYDAVIDDSIEDYTVIYYYPVLTGTSSHAILYNQDTNRVIECHYAAIR